MREQSFGEIPFRNRLAGAAMTGILAVTGCSAPEQIMPQPYGTSVIETAPAPVATPVVVEGCPAPTEDELAATEALIDAPHPVIDISGYINDPDPRYDARNQLVERLGLTFFDPSEAFNKLGTNGAEQKIDLDYAPIGDYLVATNDFLQNYGLKLAVGVPDTGPVYDATSPSLEDLDNLFTKTTLLNIITTFAVLPKEYVDLAKVDTIRLISSPADKGVHGYVSAWSVPDSNVYLNINKDLQMSVSGGVINHELFHKVDMEFCGSVNNRSDPSFDALNEGMPAYNNLRHDPSVLNTLMYYDAVDQLRDQYDAASVTGDREAFCNIVNVKNNMAAEVLTDSYYHPNIGEDKAEIGGQIPQPGMHNELTDPRFKKLRKKFVHLMATRVYRYAPKVAEYLTTISQAPSVIPDEQGC